MFSRKCKKSVELSLGSTIALLGGMVFTLSTLYTLLSSSSLGRTRDQQTDSFTSSPSHFQFFPQRRGGKTLSRLAYPSGSGPRKRLADRTPFLPLPPSLLPPPPPPPPPPPRGPLPALLSRGRAASSRLIPLAAAAAELSAPM